MRSRTSTKQGQTLSAVFTMTLTTSHPRPPHPLSPLRPAVRTCGLASVIARQLGSHGYLTSLTLLCTSLLRPLLHSPHQAGRENVCRGVEAALRRAADIVAAQQAQEGPGNGNGSNGNGTKAKSVSRGATASKANAAAAANGNGNGSDVQAAHPAHQQQKGNGGLHGYGVAMASAELEDLWTSAAVPKAVSHVASGGRWDRLTGLRGGVPVEEGEGEGKAGVKGGKGAVGGFGGSVDGVAQREEEREV